MVSKILKKKKWLAVTLVTNSLRILVLNFGLSGKSGGRGQAILVFINTLSMAVLEICNHAQYDACSILLLDTEC
jgi:hypothetical protein